MDAEQIRTYCLGKKGVSESFPFNQTTLVFKVGTKMFLLLSLDAVPLSFAVKTAPDWSEQLRESYSQIKGAYHMNKTHWNSVEPEGVPSDLLFKLIDHSYELIFNSLSRKDREGILEG
ncbi:MmcQ/YjbR family DNA-binding protein [Chryseobacterium sp. A301]